MAPWCIVQSQTTSPSSPGNVPSKALRKVSFLGWLFLTRGIIRDLLLAKQVLPTHSATDPAVRTQSAAAGLEPGPLTLMRDELIAIQLQKQVLCFCGWAWSYRVMGDKRDLALKNIHCDEKGTQEPFTGPEQRPLLSNILILIKASQIFPRSPQTGSGDNSYHQVLWLPIP